MRLFRGGVTAWFLVMTVLCSGSCDHGTVSASGPHVKAAGTDDKNDGLTLEIVSPLPDVEHIAPGMVDVDVRKHGNADVSAIAIFVDDVQIASLGEPPFHVRHELKREGIVTFRAEARRGSRIIASVKRRLTVVSARAETSEDGGMTDWEAFWATTGTATRPEVIRPVAGVHLNRSEPVEIEARVDAPLTTIKHVDFYANGVKIGTVTAQPYVIYWRPQAVGPAELSVLVTDTLHADIPARPVFVTVQ